MKKISLKDVKNGLKRDEMRMILGGGCGCSPCGASCGGAAGSVCVYNTTACPGVYSCV